MSLLVMFLKCTVRCERKLSSCGPFENKILNFQASMGPINRARLENKNHPLCLFGHWFQPGQLTNGLKQTPCRGQHNMVSREQRVSWPHPDTIRKKKENAHKAIPIVSDLFYSFFFFLLLQSHRGKCVIISWRWRGEWMTVKCILSALKHSTFLRHLQQRKVWYDRASPL